MGIAHVVSSGQFNRIDLQRCEFLENRDQRQLRQQGSEDSNAHNPVLSLKWNGLILSQPPYVTF